MKGNPGLEKVEDINVLCGVIKVFLRNLREPLLTFRMHNTFMQAAGQYLNHTAQNTPDKNRSSGERSEIHLEYTS